MRWEGEQVVAGMPRRVLRVNDPQNGIKPSGPLPAKQRSRTSPKLLRMSASSRPVERESGSATSGSAPVGSPHSSNHVSRQTSPRIRRTYDCNNQVHEDRSKIRDTSLNRELNSSLTADHRAVRRVRLIRVAKDLSQGEALPIPDTWDAKNDRIFTLTHKKKDSVDVAIDEKGEDDDVGESEDAEERALTQSLGDVSSLKLYRLAREFCCEFEQQQKLSSPVGPHELVVARSHTESCKHEEPEVEAGFGSEVEEPRSERHHVASRPAVPRDSQSRPRVLNWESIPRRPFISSEEIPNLPQSRQNRNTRGSSVSPLSSQVKTLFPHRPSSQSLVPHSSGSPSNPRKKWLNSESVRRGEPRHATPRLNTTSEITFRHNRGSSPPVTSGT